MTSMGEADTRQGNFTLRQEHTMEGRTRGLPGDDSASLQIMASLEIRPVGPLLSLPFLHETYFISDKN